MIKGLIFDVDGVIINTENTHFLAYKKVLEEYDLHLDKLQYQRFFSGKSIRGGLLSLLEEHSFPKVKNYEKFIHEVAQKKIAETVHQFEKNVEYFEDAIKFIHRVYHGNVELSNLGKIAASPVMSMVTGLESVFFKYILAKHDLSNIFTVVVTADQYTHSKPNPECYQIALERMDLKPEDVVGFEDSVSGIEALNNAKIFSIAVSNTHSSKELRKAKIVINSLTKLIN